MDKCFVLKGHVDNVYIVLYCIRTEADLRTFSGVPVVISTIIGCLNVNMLIRRGRVQMISWSTIDFRVRVYICFVVLGRRRAP